MGCGSSGSPSSRSGDTKAENGSTADPENVVRTGMEKKGIKFQVTAIPIPMGCSPAFEGKSIRKEEMYVEFGGGRSPAFELLRLRETGRSRRREDHGHRSGDI